MVQSIGIAFALFYSESQEHAYFFVYSYFQPPLTPEEENKLNITNYYLGFPLSK